MEKTKRSFLPWGMVSTILTLAWPTMLEELMQTAVQYIDTAMVGAIGTQATAAVGATSTVNWLNFNPDATARIRVVVTALVHVSANDSSTTVSPTVAHATSPSARHV